MMLIYKPLNLQIDFSATKVILLVIEAASFFSRFIEDSLNSIQNESSDFVILEKDKEIDLSKNLFVCHSPFVVNLNDKRFFNAVISQLQSVFSQNDIYINKYNELTSGLEQLIFDICDDSDFNLEISAPPPISSIFKLYNLKIEEGSSLLEITVDYLSVISKISSKSVVIFCNLKSYFSAEELLLIYKHAISVEVHLIMLESFHNENVTEYEDIMIVDKDLCII